MANRARSDKLFRVVTFFFIASLIVFSGFGVAQADPTAVSQAQKEAQALKDLIDKLEVDVSAADESYNYAAEQLEQTRAAESRTKSELAAAEGRLDAARQQLMTRLVDIYKHGEASMLGVLLDATTYSDFVNRLDQLGRVSEQDRELVGQVTDYLAQVEDQKAILAKQAKQEEQKVAELADAKERLAVQLAAQENALQGKELEIAQLQKEEQAEQAARAAAAKKAAEEAAAQQAAVERQSAAVKVATASADTPSTSSARASSEDATTNSGNESTGGDSSSTSKSTSTSASTSKSADSAAGGTSGGTAGGTRAKVVGMAMSYLGVPYVWASANPSGFDCSGLVMYVFAKVGIDLPHSSAMQYQCGTHVSRDELQPGDLVFFYNPIHHVGIYIGNGQMINARTGGVRIDSAFWSSYAGATRVLE